jgi:hypothetical protein
LFENRVLRRIFEPTREELKRRRKFHIEALHKIYVLPNMIRIVLELASSVSIVSDYGLDGRGSIPDRGRGFFL